MNRSSFLTHVHVKRSVQTAVLALFTLLFVTTVSAEITLGPYTYATQDAPALVERTKLPTGIKSLRYVSKIGGVAFENTAEDKYGQFKDVQFKYNPQRPDGDRLRIVFKNDAGITTEAAASIYDWQLFPILRFALSDSYACATSEGVLYNTALQESHRLRGNWILNYHPAFQNTLLGFRLAQADFVTVIPEACDLPRKDGEYILGAGEIKPDVQKNTALWHQFASKRAGVGTDYLAHIICDYRTPIAFWVDEGRLMLSGEPSWYFVQASEENRDTVEDILRKEIAKRRSALTAQVAETEGVSPHRRQVKIKVLRQLLQEYSDNRLRARRAEIADNLSANDGLRILSTYSRTTNDLVYDFEDMNIALFDALRVTMRYAAFFRWAYTKSPGGIDAMKEHTERFYATNRFTTPTILQVSK